MKSTLFLAPRETLTVKLTEPHDPSAFYQTRSGLYVWEDFQSLIVAKAKRSDTGTSFKLGRAVLMRDLTDQEIEVAIPKEHLFEETQVSAIIANLIAKQANGKDGVLLNNGFANLFYTGSCVAHVYWSADTREWDVGTWDRDGSGWCAGKQVFSLATT